MSLTRKSCFSISRLAWRDQRPQFGASSGQVCQDAASQHHEDLLDYFAHLARHCAEVPRSGDLGALLLLHRIHPRCGPEIHRACGMQTDTCGAGTYVNTGVKKQQVAAAAKAAAKRDAEEKSR